MQNYKDFSIDIKFDGMNVLESNKYELVELIIIFEENRIPEFELRLGYVNDLSFLNFSEVEISLMIKDKYKINFKCVTTTTQLLEYGFLSGFMVTKAQLETRKSRFLGTSLSSAMSQVNLNRTLVGVPPINGEFFQLNETDVECLLRLSKGAIPFGLISIDENSINLIDMKKPPKVQEFIQPKNLEKFQRNTKSDRKVESKIYSHPKSSTIIYKNNITAANTSTEYVKNFYTNKRFNIPPKSVYILNYPNMYIPYKVGQGMTYEIKDIKLDSSYILGKIITLSKVEGVSTVLRIGEDK